MVPEDGDPRGDRDPDRQEGNEQDHQGIGERLHRAAEVLAERSDDEEECDRDRRDRADREQPPELLTLFGLCAPVPRIQGGERQEAADQEGDPGDGQRDPERFLDRSDPDGVRHREPGHLVHLSVRKDGKADDRGRRGADVDPPRPAPSRGRESSRGEEVEDRDERQQRREERPLREPVDDARIPRGPLEAVVVQVLCQLRDPEDQRDRQVEPSDHVARAGSEERADDRHRERAQGRGDR